MKSKQILVLAFIALFIAALFLCQPAMSENGQEYEEYLKESHAYSGVVNYLRTARETMAVATLGPKKLIILFMTDLFLSLACLWLAIRLVTSTKTFLYKKYLWFLFVFNLGWFVCLLLFKGSWEILHFLVVKIRPDLGAPIVDNISIVMIVAAVLLYIWFFARTFSINFWGAAGTSLIFHLIYFLIILFVSLGTPKGHNFFDLVTENIGAKQVLYSYLSDAKEITSGKSVVSFIRIRPFHL